MDDEARRTRHQRELEILGKFPKAERWSDDGEDYERGVLLSDKIEEYVKRYQLITPFDASKLKPAAYKLSVGESYAMNGDIGRLEPTGTNAIVIPPFGVVIVQTLERINMPNFLIGRWNIRVSWAYQGLFWVGGPQVDPSFRGHLFCPLYNFSDQAVTIRYGDAIAIIDFVTTTMPIRGDSIPYPGSERILIEDYNPQLKSALVELATKRIDAAEASVKELASKSQRTQDRLDNATGVTFASLGILFAAIVLFMGNQIHFDPYLFWVGILTVAFSAVSLVTAYYLFKGDSAPGGLEGFVRRRWGLVSLVGLVAFVVLPFLAARIATAGTAAELSRAQAAAASNAAMTRSLSCQIRALAAKRSIATCR
jgi:deoxycytidine triphosphate deaminase